MSKKQSIPASEVLEQNVGDHLAGQDIYISPEHGYNVCSWRPGAPGSGPTTEVHILLPIAPGAKAIMRLKSARALDELVGVLLEYRREVWPNG
jgi:hypothetical protein